VFVAVGVFAVVLFVGVVGVVVVGFGVFVGVGVFVAVGSGVFVGVGVLVAVLVAVLVGVFVGVFVGVGVGVKQAGQGTCPADLPPRLQRAPCGSSSTATRTVFAPAGRVAQKAPLNIVVPGAKLPVPRWVATVWNWPGACPGRWTCKLAV
jgi:hypothetical protein